MFDTDGSGVYTGAVGTATTATTHDRRCRRRRRRHHCRRGLVSRGPLTPDDDDDDDDVNDANDDDRYSERVSPQYYILLRTDAVPLGRSCPSRCGTRPSRTAHPVQSVTRSPQYIV